MATNSALETRDRVDESMHDPDEIIVLQSIVGVIGILYPEPPPWKRGEGEQAGIVHDYPEILEPRNVYPCVAMVQYGGAGATFVDRVKQLI